MFYGAFHGKLPVIESKLYFYAFDSLAHHERLACCHRTAELIMIVR